MSNEEAKD